MKDCDPSHIQNMTPVQVHRNYHSIEVDYVLLLADFASTRDPETITVVESVDRIQQVVPQKNGGKLKREAALQIFMRHLLKSVEQVCKIEDTIRIKDTSSSGFIHYPTGKVNVCSYDVNTLGLCSELVFDVHSCLHNRTTLCDKV